MATVTGDLTIQCSTLDEFNTNLANAQSDPNCSNITSNASTLVITCHVNNGS